MMKGFSQTELDDLRLWPIQYKSRDINYYVHLDHPLWEGDETRFVHAMGNEANWNDAYPVFKRCTAAVRLKQEETFFPLNLFEREVKNGRTTWETSIRSLKNAMSGEVRKEFREKNIQFLRMYATGSVDGRIHCPILCFQIDSVTLFGVTQNAWVQHHFRFLSGVSFHKEHSDPGNILASTDFTVVSPRSREGLKDMARTIFLSATAHDALHRAKRDGDIHDYLPSQLPWALQSEQNWLDFNGFLMSFGHEPLGDFFPWILEQTN